MSEKNFGVILCTWRKTLGRGHPPARFDVPEEQYVYAVLVEGKYRWRKLSTVAKRANLPTVRAQQVLGKLEAANLVRKLPTPSIDGQELWAATATVGVMPRL
jgi:hypothetical protein